MEKRKDLLSMIYQVKALSSAIADSQERAFGIGDKYDPEEAEKLASLVYLLEDYMVEVKEEAERRLDFPDNRRAAVEKENDKLRQTVIELQLKLSER